VLRTELLSEGELGAEHFQLWHEVRVVAKGELGLDPSLNGPEPQLLQPTRLELESQGLCYVSVWVTSP
jgi:hypothetical protein